MGLEKHHREALSAMSATSTISGCSLQEVARAMAQVASAGFKVVEAFRTFGGVISNMKGSDECLIGCVGVDRSCTSDRIVFTCSRCKGVIAMFDGAEVAGMSITEADSLFYSAVSIHRCPLPVRFIRV